MGKIKQTVAVDIGERRAHPTLYLQNTGTAPLAAAKWRPSFNASKSVERRAVAGDVLTGKSGYRKIRPIGSAAAKSVA